MLNLPIGVENYKTIIKQCYYVDKTKLIGELARLPDGSSLLLTRPRRFGKSLALSMVETFFECREEDPRPYFAGKEIEKDDYALEQMGRYPVIRINFKECLADDVASFRSQFLALARLEFSRQKINVDDLKTPYLRSYFEKLEQEKLSLVELANFATNLCQANLEVYAKKSVLLIDEYDRPLTHARDNKDVYKDVLSFFQIFLGGATKGNAAARFTLVTGVLRIAKESLFSGPNSTINEDVLSIRFAPYFGFTQEETQAFLTYFGKGDSLDLVTRWYGGYNVGNMTMVNPWSLMYFLREGLLIPYWVNTTDNASLKSLLESDGSNVMDILTSLLQGNEIVSDVRLGISFDQLNDVNAVLSVLLSSGYLTPKYAYDGAELSLTIPNLEVGRVFRLEILGRFFRATPDADLAKSLKRAMENGDAKSMEILLNTKILGSFSYYETSDPRAYHALVLGLVALLFADDTVSSEVITGDGRADIIVSSRLMGRYGAVIEVKSTTKTLSSKQLLAKAESALKQIERQGYAELLKRKQAHPIYGFGIAFMKKTAKVVAKELTV